jgi:dTDP-4-amino-4,6-dideoxygalactose transaminase
VSDKGVDDLSNMIGHNFRLGEIECAIGIEQLKKLKKLVTGRQKAAERLTARLGCLPGLRTPGIRKDCTHAYYVYPLVLEIEKLGIGREMICKALIAEGVEGIAEGYATIHLLPMYQKKIAYGSKGFPWKSDICKRDISYTKGICPVAEKLDESSFVGFAMCLHELNEEDVDLVAKAFLKVWANLESLK